MKKIWALEVNPPKAANAAQKGTAVMATKALTKWQKHTRAFAKAHEGEFKSAKALTKAASKTYTAVAKTAKAAHRAVAKRASQKQVTMRPVREGAGLGGKRIDKVILALAKNPGDFADRLKRAFSGPMVGTVAGLGAGGALAIFVPMAFGKWNEGWGGVGLSAGGTIIGAAGAALFMPAAVIPVAAGGTALTLLRLALVASDKAFQRVLAWIADWGGAAPKGPPQATTSAGAPRGLDGVDPRRIAAPAARERAFVGAAVDEPRSTKDY